VGQLRSATGFDRDALKRLSGAVQHQYEYARQFSSADRQRAEKEGAAMAGGKYPIYNQTDLDNAVKDYNRTGQPSAVKAHIQKRAKALNLKDPFDNNEDD
jgi:hypothetical protein